jgi:hypothetical protein
MSEQKSSNVVSPWSLEMIRLIKEFNIKVFAHYVKIYQFVIGLTNNKDYEFSEPFHDIYGNHHKILCKCDSCFGLKKSIKFDKLFQSDSMFQIGFSKIRLEYNDIEFYSQEPNVLAAKIINNM